MKNENNVMEYSTPVCNVLSISTQTVICGSETEKVTETSGEW